MLGNKLADGGDKVVGDLHYGVVMFHKCRFILGHRFFRQAGADLFSKVGGSSQQSRESAADLRNRFALRLRRGSADNPVVLGVGSDPEPVDSVGDVSSQRPVMFADAHAPKIANPFEMQERVTRIGLEEGKVLVSQHPNFGGQRFI